MESALSKYTGKCILAFVVLLATGALSFAQNSQAAKNEALFDAAQSGTAADIRAAIKAGANVNARFEEGMSALMCAAGFNTNADVTRCLIDAGSDVNATTIFTWCLSKALLLAASYNTNPDVVKTLLDAGADDKDNALVYAAYYNTNPDVIKILLDAGADVNARDVEREYGRRRMSALMYAAAFNWDPEVIKLLLDAGANQWAKKEALDYLEIRTMWDDTFAASEAYRKMKELLQ